MSIGKNALGGLRPATVLLLIVGLLASPAAWSLQPRTYFAPLPEDQVLQSLRDIANSSTPKSPVTSVISLTIVTGGTIVYWDQWENGYEGDIFSPGSIYSAGNPQGTQIWGDRNLANGCPPIKTGAVNPCAVPEDDFVRAGDVLYTRNEVPIRGSNGSYSRNPSDDCKLWPNNTTLVDHCFDGRDKIAATFPLTVSRAAWANGSGSLLAGALEVSGSDEYLTAGGSTEAPVGPNSQNSESMFQYSALYVMGGAGGASGTVTRPGQSTVSFNLAQGQGTVVRYNQEGATVTLSSGTAQVHLITGDIGASYESRWYQLLPTAFWSTEYITPVGTVNNHCTRVFLYNPGASSLAVSYTDGNGGSSTINVPSNSSRRSPAIPDGFAARFTAGSPFYAVSATDCEGSTELMDWGFPLVPVPRLTTQYLVGWAPGCTTSNCGPSGSGSNTASRSPIWITPASGTGVDIYVDFDGKGASCISKDLVFGKVLKLTLSAGQAAKVTDDPPPNSAIGSQGDYDMTGARVFTCDGTEFSVVWGQDPLLSGNSDSEGLDMGTGYLPLGSEIRCSIVADKDLIVVGGDTNVTYTFKIYNDGETPLAGVSLLNEYTSGTANPVTPTGTPTCQSPVFVGGDTNNDAILQQEETWEYSCTVDVVPEQVQPPVVPPQYIPVINAAIASSLNPTLDSLACSWEVDLYQVDLDFGDTPVTYGAPAHEISGTQLHMGSIAPDIDPGLQASVGADGDDTNGVDDEDGVTFTAFVGGSVVSTVQVNNASGGNATLCGWIDGESDGTKNDVFDIAEGQCVTVPPNGSGDSGPCTATAGGYSCDLVWTVPNSVQSGRLDTYARFRLSTDALTTADGGLGTASDGEVEDYAVSFYPTSATIGWFRVGIATLDDLGLIDPETGLPRIDPRTGKPLELPPGGAALVQWQTLSERGTLGFNLDRWDGGVGRWSRVNDDLLPGLIDAPFGGEYRLFDLDVSAGERHRYRLIELEAWGDQRVYGPYDVVVGGAATASAQAATPRRAQPQAATRDIAGDGTEAEWGAWRQLDSLFQGRPRQPGPGRPGRMEGRP